MMDLLDRLRAVSLDVRDPIKSSEDAAVLREAAAEIERLQTIIDIRPPRIIRQVPEEPFILEEDPAVQRKEIT